MRGFGATGKYLKDSIIGGCNRAYCGIWKVREDMTLRSLLVVGAWRVQVHWVDQAWRVFCYSCTPTLFSSESISTWRVAERFFAKFFDFFFDNTSRCYLVFASLFPTLKFYFILLIMDEYGLGQCYRLFALIYSYSALSLNQSKSNLAVILIWESKQAFMFSHKFELSYIYIYIYVIGKCNDWIQRINFVKKQKIIFFFLPKVLIKQTHQQFHMFAIFIYKLA